MHSIDANNHGNGHRRGRGDVPRIVEVRPARLPEAGVWNERPMQPSIDVVETSSSIVVRIELPGHRLEDIELSIADDVLTVVSERKPIKPAEGVFHVSERSLGPYCRRIVLPAPVCEDATATLSDGVLQVVLRKTGAARSSDIEVS